MGAFNSKHYRHDQNVTLVWNDELIGSCFITDLERNFPRLRRGIPKFEPKGDRISRTGQHTLIYDLAPCKDVVLWARSDHHTNEDAHLISPMRFGGSEALRIVVFTLFWRVRNMQKCSVNAALSEAFTGYQHRHDFNHRDGRPQIGEEDLGERDITAFLSLLESFVEVSTALDCLDNGNSPTRLDIEHSYLKYRKHIKHNLDDIEESLRFLRIGDVLSDTQMVQDFTFSVLTSFDTLFRKYHTNAHNITFAQYGERQWNLSRRLCDFLELEHKEFLKRKKAREQVILNEVPLGSRPLIPGIDGDLSSSGMYEEGVFESMFITLSPAVLQRIIESSPVTVDPTQGIHPPSEANLSLPNISGVTNRGAEHDHVVIQFRVFRDPTRQSLGITSGGSGDRLTPLQTPIPSRRGSPAPTDYFFADHGFPPRSSGALGVGVPNGRGHGLNRSNTYHGVEDHFGYHHKGDFSNVDLGRFKEDRFRGRGLGGVSDMGMMMEGRGVDGFSTGLGGMGIGMGMDLQTVTARLMEKAVKEEKKREYVMPWARNGNGTLVNGAKLIGYTGEGYRA
ncbi:hypothetical protein ABW19_dt0205671 [Dactylella cylindrospora]|nr:hypothetical protein ABW19_dt0205671 [Dactylella cylindrospora]